MTSPIPAVKPDPEVQEEHDELLMSYLNADCLSGDSWPLPTDEHQQPEQPLSPPYSTSSDGSINNTEDAYTGKSEDMFAPALVQPTAAAEAAAAAPGMMDYTSWLAAAAAAAGLPQAGNLPPSAACWPTTAAPPPPPEFLQSFVPPYYLQQAAAAAANVPLLQPSLPQDIKPPTSSASSCTSSSSDSEQPKKKRGRKKRDPTVGIAPAPAAPLRPLARLLPASAQPQQPSTPAANTPSPPPPPPAASPQQQQPSSPSPPPQPQPQQQQQPPALPSDHATATPVPSLPAAGVKMEPAAASLQSQEEVQKAAAIAKRQERLIKNRAAALLSRKRKREHLNALEDEKQNLSNENEQLRARVAELEARVDFLETENHELRRRVPGSSNSSSSSALLASSNNKNTTHNKATGVVFMIILFSFALFSLPSRTVNQLTVGGSSPRQLVGGSASSLDLTFFGGAPSRPTLDSGPSATTSTTPSTDLVLIDPVRPHALRSWIQDRLTIANSNNNNRDGNEKGLVQWASPQGDRRQTADATIARPHIYLYSREFSQVAPIMNDTASTTACGQDGAPPTYLSDSHSNAAVLSLISPMPAEKNTTYLQIDVQVLGSRVIDGPLMSLDQCPFATTLLDNMKDDLLCTRPASALADNSGAAAAAAAAAAGEDDNATAATGPHVVKLAPSATGRRLNKDIRRRLVGEERARKIARVAD